MTQEYIAAYIETVLSTRLFDLGARDGLLEWARHPGQPTEAEYIYATPGALTDEQWHQLGRPELIVGNTLEEIASIVGVNRQIVVRDYLRRIGRVDPATDEGLLAARASGAPVARARDTREWIAAADWLGRSDYDWRRILNVAPGLSSWEGARRMRPAQPGLSYFPGTVDKGLWLNKLQNLPRHKVG